MTLDIILFSLACVYALVVSIVLAQGLVRFMFGDDK
jgi:uncharacterized membrane protein YhdT